MELLHTHLAALTTMSSAQLKDHWRALTQSPVPKISPSMLRLALAWELQARVHGGLSRDTQRKLDQFAAGKTRTRAVAPGMRLVREWGGKAHIVVIADDGSIQWNDRQWRSLSEVAKAITGTHWSGPAFFGLKRRLAA